MRPIAASAARIVACAVGATALVVCALFVYCVAMPGNSYRGRTPPLSNTERAIADDLRAHVTQLSVDIGERRAALGDTLGRAEAYLHEHLQGTAAVAGSNVRLERLVKTKGDANNVILDLPGTRSSPIVIVGAHYDSAPGTPGANDNASGTAAALVLADRLVHAEHELPIRIVMFANEEPPYFGTKMMGSFQHARGCRERGESIRAMLSLETMGYFSDKPGSQRYPRPLSLVYPDRGNFIAFVGDLGSRTLVREAVRSFRSHAAIPSEGAALPAALPGVGWSDHWSFWQFGYSAVMVTDTALFRDPNYHERTDAIANLDFEKLARVVIGLERVIRALAAE